MPIEVKDIEWSETEQFVVIKVPLKGASTKNVDIFSTDSYIKVSFPPYFYELALYAQINDDASKATISNGQVVFNLEKCEHSLWQQLHVSQHKDKAFMKKLREDALEYKQGKEKEKVDKLNKEKDEQRKFAVREQMRIDSEERKRVEMLKNAEEANVTKEIQDWKLNDAKNQQQEQQQGQQGQQHQQHQQQQHVQEIFDDTTSESKNMSKSTEKKSVPTPRSCGKIEVQFTTRILPTPARESKLPEEEIWLQKLAEMNKMKKMKEDATDIEETNPIWLKDKGDEFFKKANYVAAINAYTSALLLDSKIPMLYSNRAACHLSLKQYKECIQDCTSALELYDPPVQANLLSRCRAYTRRGTGLFHMEEYVDALQDYEAAMKLDPKNDALKNDAYKIRRIIQGGESSD